MCDVLKTLGVELSLAQCKLITSARPSDLLPPNRPSLHTHSRDHTSAILTAVCHSIRCELLYHELCTKSYCTTFEK